MNTKNRKRKQVNFWELLFDTVCKIFNINLDDYDYEIIDLKEGVDYCVK